MAGESRKARITRMHRQYETLCEFIPTVKCQLDFHTPFELLVATILSAQTTDKRVNSITPELFGTYPTAAALADARLEDVESIIRPLGFYHVKAEHIIAVARQIVERFGGQIPQTMEELTSLPGVGRKTANVVLGNAFRVPGFPVDTHVIRVTGRLHWRDDWMKTSTTPERIEQEITGSSSSAATSARAAVPNARTAHCCPPARAPASSSKSPPSARRAPRGAPPGSRVRAKPPSDRACPAREFNTRRQLRLQRAKPTRESSPQSQHAKPARIHRGSSCVKGDRYPCKSVPFTQEV